MNTLQLDQLAGRDVVYRFKFFFSANTNLTTSVLTQRQSVSFSAPLSLLKYYLHQLSDDVVTIKTPNNREALKIFGAITIVKEVNMLLLEVRTS